MTNGVGDTNRSGYYEAGETPEGRNELTVTDIEKIEAHSQTRNPEATTGDGKVTLFEIDAFYAFQQDGTVLSVPENPVVEDQGALSASPGDAGDITDRPSFRDAVTAYLKANYGNLTGDELVTVESVAIDWIVRNKGGQFNNANFEAWKAAPETIEYLNKVNDPNAQVGKITEAGVDEPEPVETAETAKPGEKVDVDENGTVDGFQDDPAAGVPPLTTDTPPTLEERMAKNSDLKAFVEKVEDLLPHYPGRGFTAQQAVDWVEAKHPEGGGYMSAYQEWHDQFISDRAEELGLNEPAKPDETAAQPEPAAATAETKPAPKKEEDDGPDSDSIL